MKNPLDKKGKIEWALGLASCTHPCPHLIYLGVRLPPWWLLNHPSTSLTIGPTAATASRIRSCVVPKWADQPCNSKSSLTLIRSRSCFPAIDLLSAMAIASSSKWATRIVGDTSGRSSAKALTGMARARIDESPFPEPFIPRQEEYKSRAMSVKPLGLQAAPGGGSQTSA